MARVMKWMAVIFGLLTALLAGLYIGGQNQSLSFAITFGTFFYHFAMRLAVGYSVNAIMQNKADWRKRWYQLHPFEIRLYKFLKVKKWKGKLPTYDPSCFDPQSHSWDEIAQAMCQAEIVHKVIIAFSFLPLLAAIPFGAFGVFLITSIIAAMCDLTFVIIQRYNRSRIIKLISKERTAK